MSRWRAIGAASIALGGIWPAAALAAGPVRVAAAFDRGARLGAATALHVDVRVDGRRARSPVTELRLLYPESLGLVSSGLGLAACTRPPSDFVQVLIKASGLAGCSPNAVIGFGTAVADVRLGDGEVIPEYATLTVLTGPIQHGSLGLVVYVEGEHPFGAYLAYAGEVGAAPAPFGGMLAIRVPAIPALDGFAVVSLVHLSLVIGSRAITYHERVGRRTIAFHPDGIALPRRCPKHGFRFRAALAFQDGSRGAASTSVTCARLASKAAR